LRHLHQRGHTLHPIRLPATKHALSAYYILAPAEASSNLAKYDGVRFGSRADGIDGTPDSVLFAKTRGEGFGSEVQRRILLGAFSLSAQAIDNYFIQAQKVRRLVQQDFNNVFARPNPLSNKSEWNSEGVDVILCPTATSSAPSLSEVETQDPIHSYMNDVFTVPASLAGLPAISIPSKVQLEEGDAGYEKCDTFFSSIGFQIIGQYGDDELVLNLAKQFEEISHGPQDSHAPRTAWGHSIVGDSEADKITLRAMELDITKEESRVILEAEEGERQAKTLKLLEEAAGIKHLDEAAKMHGITRDAYIARWVSYEDPVAAERANYNYEVQQRVESAETQAQEDKVS
jgi:aspartyl-tRNA(Asn)/glutamyl-tRNA(Gln) amidotransferase subunit A